MATLEQQAEPEVLELLDNLVQLGLQVPLVHQDLQVVQVILDQVEHKVPKEPQDHQERLDLQVYQEFQVLLGAHWPTARLVLQDPLVVLEIRALQDFQETLEQLELQDHLEIRDLSEVWDPPVRQEQLGIRGLKGLLARLEIQVQVAQPEVLEGLVSVGQQVRLVLLAHRGLPEHQGMVRLALVYRVLQVNPEIPGLWAPPGLQA